MTEPHTLRIERITVPDSLDAPDAGPFLEIARIGNAMCLHDVGHSALDQDAAELLGFWQATDDWTLAGFSASRDGVILGIGTLTVSTQPGTRTADFDVMVDPDRWGEGAEEALLAAVEEEARRLGVRVIQTWTLHRPGAVGESVVPTTGWGGVPAGDRQTRFQMANGFALEQVERNSGFDLHGDFSGIERMLAEAEAVAGSDYRTVSWTGETPERYLDSFAHTLSRMSTDAPQGGLDIEEQHWDAARVRRRDARLAASGMTVSVTAVEHVATGAIAAYNELLIGGDGTGATQQYGTLVIAAHRGHRLGMIVKCANLLRWRTVAPHSPRVSTFNAEENRYMLSINEALGFVPISYAGAWKKELSEA